MKNREIRRNALDLALGKGPEKGSLTNTVASDQTVLATYSEGKEERKREREERESKSQIPRGWLVGVWVREWVQIWVWV